MGLTGGIGSGKSTVARRLVQRGARLTLRRAQVGLSHNLKEGRPGAIQIDMGGAGNPLMKIFARIFLQVRTAQYNLHR